MSDDKKARLDADGTAKPKTEIVGVFPEGKKSFYSNAESLIHRDTGRGADDYGAQVHQAASEEQYEHEINEARREAATVRRAYLHEKHRAQAAITALRVFAPAQADLLESQAYHGAAETSLEHCEHCGGTSHGRTSWNAAIEACAKLFDDWLCIDHGGEEIERIQKMIRGLTDVRER